MTVRLSKAIRTAIVDAILKDTKQVNYKALLDAEAAKIVKARRSDEELAFFKKHRHHIQYRNHGVPTDLYSHSYSSFGDPVQARYIRDNRYYYVDLLGEVSEGIQKALKEGLLPIFKRRTAQHDKRVALEAKLTAALAQMNTVAELEKRYPEFVKYVPATAVTPKYQLATTEVMGMLADAGWPDGKKGDE